MPFPGFRESLSGQDQLIQIFWEAPCSLAFFVQGMFLVGECRVIFGSSFGPKFDGFVGTREKFFGVLLETFSSEG